jgi:hypothetical protein
MSLTLCAVDCNPTHVMEGSEMRRVPLRGEEDVGAVRRMGDAA